MSSGTSSLETLHGRKTVLRSDHCPGFQSLSLHERVKGAPNFRKLPSFTIYGVANLSIVDMLVVIQRIGGTNTNHPILWNNMREEPIIYINGNPYRKNVM
jgi:hypothetical protein